MHKRYLIHVSDLKTMHKYKNEFFMLVKVRNAPGILTYMH